MNHRDEIGFRVGILSNTIHRRIDQEIHAVQDNPCTALIAALGRINAALARMADAVYELVCGIPIPEKGALLI